ncbi:hypothetical protein [Rhizobium halophilum]|uniref:hypothetical protein n=1 Tax=Rhizobium halophilum TaxID=2846852 RepID=UPI001EFD599F|nr:hypothetical protein [Rhizobium halophilum]MCF6371299.1 hypothetical protein [Rhizobium halophilum]
MLYQTISKRKPPTKIASFVENAGGLASCNNSFHDNNRHAAPDHRHDHIAFHRSAALSAVGSGIMEFFIVSVQRRKSLSVVFAI